MARGEINRRASAGKRLRPVLVKVYRDIERSIPVLAGDGQGVVGAIFSTGTGLLSAAGAGGAGLRSTGNLAEK